MRLCGYADDAAAARVQSCNYSGATLINPSNAVNFGLVSSKLSGFITGPHNLATRCSVKRITRRVPRRDTYAEQASVPSTSHYSSDLFLFSNFKRRRSSRGSLFPLSAIPDSIIYHAECTSMFQRLQVINGTDHFHLLQLWLCD